MLNVCSRPRSAARPVPSPSKPCSVSFINPLLPEPRLVTAALTAAGAAVLGQVFTAPTLKSAARPANCWKPPSSPPSVVNKSSSGNPKSWSGGLTTDVTPRATKRGPLRSALTAAVATIVGQLVNVPLDVAFRGGHSPRALLAMVRAGNFGVLFRGLPMHVMKRAPTKFIAAFLLESTCHSVLSAGLWSIAATYPLHLWYYSWRQGVGLGAIAARAATRPSALYAGLAPALLSVAPVAAAASAGPRALSTIAASLVAHPLRKVANKTAVATMSSAASTGPRAVSIVQQLLRSGGPSELWRGFPKKMVRYACTGCVSGAVVSALRAN